MFHLLPYTFFGNDFKYSLVWNNLPAKDSSSARYKYWVEATNVPNIYNSEN